MSILKRKNYQQVRLHIQLKMLTIYYLPNILFTVVRFEVIIHASYMRIEHMSLKFLKPCSTSCHMGYYRS